jgi:hypothetical protein
MTTPGDETRLTVLRDQWELNAQQLMQVSQLSFTDYQAARALIDEP